MIAEVLLVGDGKTNPKTPTPRAKATAWPSSGPPTS